MVLPSFLDWEVTRIHHRSAHDSWLLPDIICRPLDNRDRHFLREVRKSEKDIKQREQAFKERGYWICDKCGRKYYASFDCRPCMLKELGELLYDQYPLSDLDI